MTNERKVAWRDMPASRRRRIVVAGAVQVSLALAAWRDLARRPAVQVNGSKRLWALAIAVNFVGPIAYFRWGRRHDLVTELETADEATEE